MEVTLEWREKGLEVSLVDPARESLKLSSWGAGGGGCHKNCFRGALPFRRKE